MLSYVRMAYRRHSTDCRIGRTAAPVEAAAEVQIPAVAHSLAEEHTAVAVHSLAVVVADNRAVVVGMQADTAAEAAEELAELADSLAAEE